MERAGMSDMAGNTAR